MTDQTAEFKKSTLERKDRDELNSIAAALGLKAPSRLRKAEIVQLILDSVSDDPAPESSGPDEAGKADDSSNSDKPAADASGSKDGGDSKGQDGGTKGGDQAGQADQADQADKGDQGDKAESGDSAGEVYHAGDEGGRGRNRQPEGGNRKKRRRRSRDRDRNGDEGAEFSGDPTPIEGHLDLRSEGYGFLRTTGYMATRNDPYISVKMVRQFDLRPGDHVAGTARPANRNEKNPAMVEITKINNGDPAKSNARPNFDDLTPLFPDMPLTQAHKDDPYNLASRIIDMVAPIGKGQRGLIVSPPKAGKTTILKSVASSIETNNPEVKLLVLLVDERPEEVTDMRRHLKTGEVIGSTFDRPAEDHILAAEMVINRAKRLVESGEDVVILLDGITRLTRAYNMVAPANGRVMSGGLDASAIYPPKKFFGAARNVEEGGSLTIVATALVETGSRMDEVIFEEFKGTGNMELKLDRRAAERRVFPAIDIDASSTRHEELLLDKKDLQQIVKLRRALGALSNDENPVAGLELLVERLTTVTSNADFLSEVAKGSSFGN